MPDFDYRGVTTPHSSIIYTRASDIIHIYKTLHNIFLKCTRVLNLLICCYTAILDEKNVEASLEKLF